MDKFTYQDENGTEGNMLVISGDREEHWAIPEDFNYIKLGIQNLVMIC
ncbi:MAG: hypothetical protein LRY71_03795 [Bacillaceae bacterium]|nr:hypothetical protein [Bacillaceae bacterium]